VGGTGPSGSSLTAGRRSRLHRGGKVTAHENSLEDRVAALEQAMSRLSDELVTRRLEVSAPDGNSRLVAESAEGATELRLELGRTDVQQDAQLLLFAVTGNECLPAGVGLQVWLDGNCLFERCNWIEQRRENTRAHWGDA
jgi:hypothetical protein